MDKFREKFIEIFNKCNITTDSTYSNLELELLNLNLRIFDYVNNKIQIILNEDLNCEHTLEYNNTIIVDTISNEIISNNMKEIYDFIYYENIKHIDEELLEHKTLTLNIFVYSIIIDKDFIKFKGNFKFK